MLNVGIILAIIGTIIMLIVPLSDSLKSTSFAYGFCILVVGILCMMLA